MKKRRYPEKRERTKDIEKWFNRYTTVIDEFDENMVYDHYAFREWYERMLNSLERQPKQVVKKIHYSPKLIYVTVTLTMRTQAEADAFNSSVRYRLAWHAPMTLVGLAVV